MKRLTRLLFLFTSLLFSISNINAQEEGDTIPKKSGFFHNILETVTQSITVSKEDSINRANIVNGKSEVPFLKYSGRVIRSISTIEMGFEKVFTDTSQKIEYTGTRIINALHIDTYDWVIRDNLFIKEGSRLNPFLIADNERYLRSLEFIQDARILVKPVKGTKDSVDIAVITKDLFSITGSLSFSGVDRQRIRVSESNLAGAGQKVQITTLHDGSRSPVWGYDVLYSKTSIAHSFITGTVGYSKINADLSGKEDVESFYLLLDRPLFSPYARYAGGFQLSFNKPSNSYGKPDSLFLNYKNAYIDLWGGYNLSIKTIEKDFKSRNRTFLALRYLQNNLIERPFQFQNTYHNFFNNRKGVLGEITFFKQEFYKTNFIYGFGTTEDVPYGYNIAVTSGWIQYEDLKRSYVGLNANRYVTFEGGRFMQYFLRTGTFFNSGKMQDASLLIGGSFFSRLRLYRKLKMRHFIKASFTRLFNRITYDPLQINNELGLRYFGRDVTGGTQRLSVYGENFFFMRRKILGFQFSPFVFGDASVLTGSDHNFFKSDIYTGVGAGFRTRNVNLVFPTVELRFIYFPKKVDDMNNFKITINSDIKFRNNSNYVKAPDIIQLNSDDSNSFY